MRKIIAINPSNNQVICEVPETTEQECLKIFDRARGAFHDWRRLALSKRIELLTDLLNKLKDNSSELARLISLEMGKPITQSKGEVSSSLQTIQWNLDNAEACLAPEVTFENEKHIHKIFFEPKGVVLSIVPFNYPFTLYVWQMIQNLLVGNVVISKPDACTPQLFKLVEKITAESILPNGVTQLVFGGKEIGQFLIEQNFDMICFTGSTKTGEHINNLAATKMIPTSMELGGSAPAIICKDADTELAVSSVFASRFANCGQLCYAVKRLIVHDSLFDSVVTKLAERARTETIGDALDPKTTLGPLVNKEQLDIIVSQVTDAVNKGAKIIYGGKYPKDLSGNFYEPTILTRVTRDMRVWNEEVFGPVLPVVSFKTTKQAIELANDTLYGLGAFIFTKDKSNFHHFASEINSGVVSHNGISFSAPFNPFGGTKKSGNSRIRGKHGFRAVCNMKLVSFEK